MSSSKSEMEATIRRYYDGCNGADRELMLATLTPDAVHYFPEGAAQGPFIGAEAIADGWVGAVERLDSRWTIDRIATDPERRTSVVEWTHWKAATGETLRGAEFIEFAGGRISEIRAYYACPPAASSGDSAGLGGFDYGDRGYPTAAPEVTRSDARA